MDSNGAITKGPLAGLVYKSPEYTAKMRELAATARNDPNWKYPSLEDREAKARKKLERLERSKERRLTKELRAAKKIELGKARDLLEQARAAKQRANDIMASREPAPDRVDGLERRISAVERGLNSVLQHLRGEGTHH